MSDSRTKLEGNSPYTIIRRLTPQPTGMGDVYLAEVRARYVQRGQQFNLPAQVVLKASKPENKLQDRLRKEVDLLRRCQHPNVVRIFPDPRSTQQSPIYTASYTIDGTQRYQYAMEYVGKQSAAQLLEQKGRLGIQETLRIGIDIAKALEHIHAHHMVNLDIKPSNIVLRQATFWACLLGQRTQAVLCDFGTARLFTDRAHNYGTDGFASPEQAQERAGQISPVDQRSDLFSLGATLYTLLSGEPPCPQSLLYAVTPIEPLAQRNPNVSPELSAVIAKTLAVDPNQRYQQATELRQALERHVSVIQLRPCQNLALLLSAIVLCLLFVGPPLAPSGMAPNFWGALATVFGQLPIRPTPAATPSPVQPTRIATVTPTALELTSTALSAQSTSTRVPTITPGATPTISAPTPLTPATVIASTLVSNTPTEPLAIRNPKPGVFIDGPTVVHWRWTGKLAANQSFEIQLWHDQDHVHYGAVDAKLTTPAQTRRGEYEYEYVLNFKMAHSVLEHGGTEYNLAVAIVQIDPYQFIGPVSAPIRVKVAN